MKHVVDINKSHIDNELGFVNTKTLILMGVLASTLAVKVYLNNLKDINKEPAQHPQEQSINSTQSESTTQTTKESVVNKAISKNYPKGSPEQRMQEDHDKFIEDNPILNYLPHSTTHYALFGNENNNHNVVNLNAIIYIHSSDTREGSRDDAIDKYKVEISDWLVSKDIDPASIKIFYTIK